MKILWCTWKDKTHPLAGGAEVVASELATRLVKNGHEVIFLVGGYDGAKEKEQIHGYRVIRLGNRWTVYWKAFRYYQKYLRGWADVVIDEVNTIPFFCRWYVKEPNLLLVHQLCRKIWFYEMFFPVHIFGYLMEPIYLWLLRKQNVITVSESTKKDLQRFGFVKENIHIISEGIEMEPIQSLEKQKKFEVPTVFALGSLRAMKRTLHILQAFELVKQRVPVVQLLVAGDAKSQYGQRVLKFIEQSVFASSIHFLGRVSTEKKMELMRRSHVLCVTSVKEGWGLVVTEANSQGTPAVVYNVDGLRDSVRHEVTGRVCDKNTPEVLAENILSVLQDKEKYQELCFQAYQWSKEITFDQSFKDFLQVIEDHV